MNHILLVAVGGALGSVARYLTGLAALRWFGPGYPWGTLSVNIVGGLAIGVFAELIARRFDGSQELRLFIITGILGGFTTFSAFSLEVSTMAERGDYLWAASYILLSIVISVAAVFAGLALVRALV
ncbi:fluoride efflux transporter CrcB [Rhizobium sp. TH2]|uniref:fluoride efflux transporter CrcB n=1 Tax=Rhizobium sp. TH2 TaxID=2775403 RepID=UPI0021578D68|nr:fluoride efflux transporter CrcB [Rhizobium sp. TH2]UVC11403.1 fluoride efflux transporter CrcB [Rhizobium sp. TH2]